MTTEEQEWDALRLIEPHLGALARPLRKVRAQVDDEYPGHTFDFVAQRDDGTVLAIEVTAAWDQQWIADMTALNKFCDGRLTRALDAAGLEPGFYVLSWLHRDGSLPELRRVPIGRLVAQCEQARSVHEVRTDEGFTVRFLGGNPLGPLARASVTGAEWADGGHPTERFARAVDDCAPKLIAAGRAGMRTVLIVVHWMLGSNDAWRTALDEAALGEHPQEVWAVDLSGFPNRNPTEQLR
jgi:hypothetical protein